ncbi:MAG: TPM domain-containing protein [Phycisphaerales bacterium]|nr:TPM domain-containing protein [Phycisphaerales bacterium]MCB9855184.1 TPM domain-containing protein [Phycisphaerales bacterium]MCB9862777.1 TPM domain-containing protein [Phycisphaerales bacterium]
MNKCELVEVSLDASARGRKVNSPEADVSPGGLRTFASGRTRTWLIVLAVCLVAARASAAPAYSIKSDWVNDYAGVLSADGKARIRALLQEVEQKAKAQIRVLVIPTTGGRDLHDLLMDIGRESGLGQKGVDHGVIVGVAVQDRKWEFVTGQGIEDTLPDTYLYSVGQEYLVPGFRNGDYAGGLFNGLAVIGHRIAQAEGVTLSGSIPIAPQRRVSGRHGRGGGGFFSCVWFFLLIMIVGRIVGASRGRGYGRWSGRSGSGGFWTAMMIGSMLNSRGRSTWGGDSGFSGFGGGSGFGSGGSFGGGSFGGGGAGGSW